MAQAPRNQPELHDSQIVFEYTQLQQKIFLDSRAKYVVASCGRRSGKTFGAVQSIIDQCLDKKDQNILWVDLQYNQLLGYVDIYWKPILKRLHPTLWRWKVSQREIHILSNTISLRSVDRPDLLVGRGYNTVILNEAGIALHEDRTLWTQIILPMMLDYPDSRAFLIGTPRGLVDRAGLQSLYYDMYLKGLAMDPQYECYKYSTYDNPYLSQQGIRDLETEIPPSLRAQELYGEFVDASETQIFKPEWWDIVDKLPEFNQIYRKFLSIDTAFSTKDSAAESACTAWIKTHGGQFFCLDLWHGKVAYPDLVRQVKRLIDHHNPDNVIIENKASGQSLIQSLKNDIANLPITPWEPGSKDKVSRAAAVTNYLEAGRVHLYRGFWNQDLINQCTIFPNGDLSDIVDTISMALGWAKNAEVNIKSIVSRKIIPTVPRGYPVGMSQNNTPVSYISRTTRGRVPEGYPV